jgi:Fur family transcriptional regulator, stress-responsive regulator
MLAAVRSPDELTQRFRERGLKVTPQRQAVFRALHGDPTHPTAEAIHARVVADMPTVSLRTVYQTLNDLAGMGEILHLHLGGSSARFDPNIERHHHAVCDVCGSVRDLFAEVDEAPALGHLPGGFRPTAAEVVVRGTCGDCART